MLIDRRLEKDALSNRVSTAVHADRGTRKKKKKKRIRESARARRYHPLRRLVHRSAGRSTAKLALTVSTH